MGATRSTYGLGLDWSTKPATFKLLVGNNPSWVGSYKVEGERWTIVMASGGGGAGARPTRFDSAGGNYLMTFERLKK